MTKLISAGLARLRLSRIFRLGMVFMLGFAAFIVANQYFTSLKYGFSTRLDNFILGYAIVIPLVAAVFSSLFLGTEYSDGTIRNKLIVGHSRAAVYLSSLVVNTAAALLMCLAFLLGVCAVGIPLMGGLKIALPRFLAMLAGSIMAVCALCAILTAICMLVSNKAIMAIACILTMLALLIAAVTIDNRLAEPELYPPNAIITIDGGIQVMDEPVENPNYLTGVKRMVYQYAFDILPTGQALQYGSLRAEHLWQMPLYSLGIVLLCSCLGLLFFKRKDLK